MVQITGGITLSGGMTLGTGSGGGATDSDFDNVALLLSGDGSNGSTTFTDLSGNNNSVTANGDTQVSTSVKQFGTMIILMRILHLIWLSLN